MNYIHKQRIIIILTSLIFISCAFFLILYALKENINLFLTPSELAQAHIKPNQTIKIGGYVKEKSILYHHSGQAVTFIVTDKKSPLVVDYFGVLPNLFRENQTVIVTGKLKNSHLLAEQVLAKHDEKYRPR